MSNPTCKSLLQIWEPKYQCNAPKYHIFAHIYLVQNMKGLMVFLHVSINVRTPKTKYTPIVLMQRLDICWKHFSDAFPTWYMSNPTLPVHRHTLSVVTSVQSIPSSHHDKPKLLEVLECSQFGLLVATGTGLDPVDRPRSRTFVYPVR